MLIIKIDPIRLEGVLSLAVYRCWSFCFPPQRSEGITCFCWHENTWKLTAVSPTNGQSRCFDRKTESVRWERVFFPLGSAAHKEMSPCAATDVHPYHYPFPAFQSGQLPICGTESGIHAVSACWIYQDEFALVWFPMRQVIRINASAKGEVRRGGGGVAEVVLHHMFDLFPSIRMESIHLSIH